MLEWLICLPIAFWSAVVVYMVVVYMLVCVSCAYVHVRAHACAYVCAHARACVDASFSCTW